VANCIKCYCDEMITVCCSSNLSSFCRLYDTHKCSMTVETGGLGTRQSTCELHHDADPEQLKDSVSGEIAT
jgi:hypothetical protein